MSGDESSPFVVGQPSGDAALVGAPPAADASAASGGGGGTLFGAGAAATPFGSGAADGGGGGAADDDDDEPQCAPEEENKTEFTPVVEPKRVEVHTIEEEEEVVVHSVRAKLSRFDTKADEWKERGAGELRLTKHSTTGRVRVLMRRDETRRRRCAPSTTSCPR
jgi:hypothetical protein